MDNYAWLVPRDQASLLVLNDSPERVLIPYLVNDLCCPRCKNNVTRIAYDYAWSYSATNGRNLASRVIHCFQCKLDFVSTDVQSRTTPLAWAGFYIGIYDRYSPEPLDPGFISLAESILGSCDSYYGAWT